MSLALTTGPGTIALGTTTKTTGQIDGQIRPSMATIALIPITIITATTLLSTTTTTTTRMIDTIGIIKIIDSTKQWGYCFLYIYFPAYIICQDAICRQFPSWATGWLDCTYWSPGLYTGLVYMPGIPRHALSGTACPGPAYPARAHMYLGFAFAVHFALNNNQHTYLIFSLSFFVLCRIASKEYITRTLSSNPLRISSL